MTDKGTNKPVTSHFINNVGLLKNFFLHKLQLFKVFRDVGEMLNTKWVTNYPEEEDKGKDNLSS